MTLDAIGTREGVDNLDGADDDNNEGLLDGTSERRLKRSATLPSLSRAVPPLIFWKQHGRSESPPGSFMASMMTISSVSATSTYSMSDSCPGDWSLGAASVVCNTRSAVASSNLPPAALL